MIVTATDFGGLVWRKSSYSGGAGDNGNCVELASLTDGRIALRDSKNPDAGPLLLTQPEFAAYLSAVKSGDLDSPA